MIISAKGIGGQIEVYKNKVVIKRKGVFAFLLQGLKGDKEIYISSISSIQLKNATWLTNGYIQFTFNGGKEAKGGIFQAQSDENTVIFTFKEQEDFEKLKNVIESIISEPNNNSSSTNSVADEIEKFSKLKENGVITDEEFQKKKNELLGI